MWRGNEPMNPNEAIRLVSEECMVGHGTAELALEQHGGVVHLAIGHLTRAREAFK